MHKLCILPLLYYRKTRSLSGEINDNKYFYK